MEKIQNMIELIEADSVRSGRGKTKGEKYGKYALAIQKTIPWIKEEIGKAKDGIIRAKNADIRKEMGGEFIKKNDTSVYWGIKYVLLQEGIVVETGTHNDGDKLLVMRLADNDDRLPPSLAKFLEPAEEDDEPIPEE
jgi:hypothetical protein